MDDAGPTPDTSPEVSRRPFVAPLSIAPHSVVTDPNTPSTAVNDVPSATWLSAVKQAWPPVNDVIVSDIPAWPPATQALEPLDVAHPCHPPTGSGAYAELAPVNPEADPYAAVNPSHDHLPPVAPTCAVIIPAAAHVRCPCCPAENNCPRTFLRHPDGKLPADLIAHAAQKNIIIPPARQPIPPGGGEYPQCVFPRCQRKPKHPRNHIMNRHLERLPWRCACNPDKTYSSRDSVNNHRTRAAQGNQTAASLLPGASS
jgi:hypothetical protein